MKITTKTQTLAAQLSAVSKAIGGRSTLPILGNILIEASKGGKITLTGTDLDVMLSKASKGETMVAGAIALPSGYLRQLVARCREESVSIHFDGSNFSAIKLFSGNLEAELGGLQAVEFPPFQVLKKAVKMKVQAKELLGALALVRHSVGEDPSRYVLNGVHVDNSEKSGLRFVATNGKCLAYYESSIKQSEGFTGIIPTKAIQLALDSFEADEDELEWSMTEAVMEIKGQGVVLQSKLIEGAYPNYRNVLPTAKGKEVFKCGRTELVEAIKTAMIFGESVKFTGQGNSILVKNNKAGEGGGVVRVDGVGKKAQPKLVISCNGKYLLATLGVLTSDQVEIACIDEMSPILISEEGFHEIIMPLRIMS